MKLDKQKDQLIIWCTPEEFKEINSFLKLKERISSDRVQDQGFDNLLIQNFIDGPLIVALDY